MISLDKLSRLPPEHRRRKLVLCLSTIEHSQELLDVNYVKKLIQLTLDDPKLPPEAQHRLQSSLDVMPDTAETNQAAIIRTINTARHALLTIIGTLPAEWDLIVPGDRSTETSENGDRHFFPELFVYAEDIRSPFNVGSIFRTAEAFGAQELILSPFCASPEHPRAQRSSMGCIGILPWEQKNLDEWITNYNASHPDKEPLPIFALETGGTPITEFFFPQRGIVILGSEELGILPETLQKATAGRVSIPMTGIKASVNVGVAFGVLMQKWTESL